VTSVSNSFNKTEIEILAFIFNTLIRGGDARSIAGHKDFPSLVAKIKRMKMRADEKRQGGARDRK